MQFIKKGLIYCMRLVYSYLNRYKPANITSLLTPGRGVYGTLVQRLKLVIHQQIIKWNANDNNKQTNKQKTLFIMSTRN